MVICKSKSNISQNLLNLPNCEFICENKPKNADLGGLAGGTAGSSALPMPKFRPIRRYLAPDLAVGNANGWRCSYREIDIE
jgi:hypothetical protein